MSDTPALSLSADDAIELAELLEFIDDWLASAPAPVAASVGRFVGSECYTLSDLRADLARFVFLVGGSPERFLGDRP